MKQFLVLLLLLSCRQPKKCTFSPPHYKAEVNLINQMVAVDFWLNAATDTPDSSYLLGFTHQEISEALFDSVYINLSLKQSIPKNNVKAITLYYVAEISTTKGGVLKIQDLQGCEVWYEEQEQMWCTLFKYTPFPTKTMVFDKPLNENHRLFNNHYKAASLVKGCYNCKPVISAIVINNPRQDSKRIKQLQDHSTNSYTDSLNHHFDRLPE